MIMFSKINKSGSEIFRIYEVFRKQINLGLSLKDNINDINII